MATVLIFSCPDVTVPVAAEFNVFLSPYDLVSMEHLEMDNYSLSHAFILWDMQSHQFT